jgi:hypothetical protein
MLIALSMYFDDEDAYSQDNYPDLTEDEIIRMMKEDFVDTILKQWSWEELMESLVVIPD